MVHLESCRLDNLHGLSLGFENGYHGNTLHSELRRHIKIGGLGKARRYFAFLFYCA